MPSIGRFEVVQPGDGEETRLRFALLDDDGAMVTGVAFNDAGMDVECAKAGGTFANFPDFATENWHEVGRGAYEVIIDGDVPAEKALLDTAGDFSLYVKTDATSSNFALSNYNVSTADVVRDNVATDARIGKLDNLDAAISTRGTADTGDAMTLEADAVDATSVEDFADFKATGFAVAGNEMDLVDAPNATGLAALAATVWASATRTLTAWLGGAKTCTFTVEDGDGNAVGSCPYVLKNSGGQVLLAGTTHTSTGEFVANLDEADNYVVTLGPLQNYSFANPHDADVGAGAAQAFTLTCTKLATPAAPADPTLCNVYAFMRHVETGQTLGAGEGSLDVIRVVSRPAGVTIVYSDDEDARTTDATGYATMNVVRGANVIIEGTWPGTGDTPRSNQKEITVPDEDTYDIGADLQD